MRLIRALLTTGAVMAVVVTGLAPATAEQPQLVRPEPLIHTVADIVPGSNGSAPSDLTVLDGVLYFFASVTPDFTADIELFSYDAVTDAAAQLTDIATTPQVGGEQLQSLTVLDGRLYFTAKTPAAGVELWVFDPATGVAEMVSDIVPGPTGSTPRGLTPLDGKLYFSTENFLTSDGALRVYDPATDQVAVLVDMGTRSPLAVGSDIYFLVTQDPGSLLEYELGRYDPATGAVTVRDDFTGSKQGVRTLLGVEYGRLYLGVEVPGTGYELWDYDPARDRLRIVTDLYPGSGSGAPDWLAGLDGLVYFSGNGRSVGNELYRLDPATRVVQLAADIGTSPSGAASYDGAPAQITAIGGRLYLSARLPRTGQPDREPFVYDPAANAGASLLQELFVGKQSGPSSTPRGFVEYDGGIFFGARSNGTGDELRRYDPQPVEAAAYLLDAAPQVVAGQPLPARLYVRNYGSTTITGSVRIQVQRPDGTVTTRTVRTGVQIGRNGVRLVSFTLTVAAGSPPGDYFAVVSFLDTNGTVLAADDIDFALVSP